jgi:peroxidase
MNLVVLANLVVLTSRAARGQAISYWLGTGEEKAMKRRERSRNARLMQAQLRLESLEQRQLLAADLVASSFGDGALLESSAADTVFADTSTAVSRTTTPRTLRFRGGVTIPSTTALDRSVDGSNNNQDNPEWGTAGEQLLRVAGVDYADGISEPGGQDRPSARVISNALATQDEETPSDRQLSAFIYAWGQFIDHDIDLTEPPETGPESFPIKVPKGDEFFDPNGDDDQFINLSRSRFDESTGTDEDNPRQQINEITAWIDGSVIYGSDEATTDSLRTHKGGKLLTSAGDLPPTDGDGNFLSGDVRVNENIELTSMHALFIREHNYWAGRIAAANRFLSDDQIFQQARAIVIAEMQSITFNEFLPALLGGDAIAPYQGYDLTVDPSIATEFSSAGFRLHTAINDDVEFFGNDGRPVGEEIELADAFFNPALLQETGVDTILKYLASTQSQEFDNEIVDSLRNFLFGQPGQGGFDLASLNIQRGRDHGLADYNSVREAYGLPRVASFTEISSDPEIQQTLESLYGSVDNIDLWVGALAEDHLPGSSVGELTQTIIVDQFQRLRDGDRYWYENIFSGRSLRQIENTSLADIISRNTTMDNLQDNVFFMQSEVTGQVFVDANGNGRQDRGEAGLKDVTVELVSDEGDVIASTTTDARGRYWFDQFHETGDYQVQVVVPNRYRATTDTVQEVLISRGDETVAGIDFGLRVQRRSNSDPPHQHNTAPQPKHHTALDTAFTDNNFSGGALKTRPF